MKDKSFKWLHLSDFHVGKDNYGQVCLFRYILNNIKDAISREQAPDAIFISGDVAQSGEKSQYETFLDEFFWPLQEILSNEPCADRIFIVPGNHDVHRLTARAVKTHGILSDIPTFLDPTPDAQFDRSPLFPRFEAFIKHDLTNHNPHWLSSVEACLTRRIDHGSYQIGVLCLNSSWLSSYKNDRHNLSIGKGILEQGLERLKDVDLRFVLSHHPIDWFLDEEIAAIIALLAKKPTLYLFGHMHKTSGTISAIGADKFIQLQAGAAFQAREDEKWINRILWGHINEDFAKVFLKPLQWSRDHQEWTVDATAFPNSCRVQGQDLWKLDLSCHELRENSSILTGDEVTATDVNIPTGWIKLDKKQLSAFSGDLSQEDVLSFFDGRVPSWREALSASIPKRTIVDEIISAFTRWTKNPSPTIFLLKGAGGEGKSTALRQIICNLINEDLVEDVLWNESAEKDVPWIKNHSDPTKLYVFASDDAELIAKEAFRLTKEVSQKNWTRVCFVFSCRNTDWITTRCDRLPWDTFAQVEEFNLRGLSEDDAKLIVKAWATFGERGLGNLQGISQEDAAAALLKEAREETYSNEGAFLGAMLRTRLGKNIGAHVKNLLVSLGKTNAPGGTLRHAFAHIAVPHSMNVLTLSKGPLAKALGCKRSEIKGKVLGPLGEEAIVAPTGTFVLTRHRAIAEAAVKILDNDFHIDTDEILIKLMIASLELSNSQIFVPELASWRFLSNYFLNAGRNELAIRLAQAAYEFDKDNAFFIVQLARNLRMSSQPEISIEIFRTSSIKVKRDRTFYFEWCISEGVAGNRFNSICLAAASLCDQADRSWPSTEDATKAFAGMSTTFGRLFELYNDHRFIEACSAAVQLGMTISDVSGEEYFAEAIDIARDAAVECVQPLRSMERLKAGFTAAWERHESDELLQHLPPVTEFSFSRLYRLMGLQEDT